MVFGVILSSVVDHWLNLPQSSPPDTSATPSGAPATTTPSASGPPATATPSPTGNDSGPNKRNFTTDDKKKAWDKATLMPGRDPTLWRLDAAGNPIMYMMAGQQGVLGYEYDHIQPFSQKGPSTGHNCQLLQTGVKRGS
uniref:HNH endonuclease n=1 Tax=Oryza meridionalis TaxID=40149 RepID=A0A0E0D886_9ORYZ